MNCSCNTTFKYFWADSWWTKMVELFFKLVVFGLMLFVKYSVGDGKWCASPQYIELGKKGILSCSLGEVYAISWYNSTILRNEYPIIHYKDSTKSGIGFASGEFDISSNGSLIITNVSLEHDHYFTVEYLQSESSDAVVINIDVIVVVKPQLRFPVVDACKNVSGLCFRNIDRPHLSCSVEHVRPKVSLRWTVKTVLGDKNISFHHLSQSDGQLFTSRVSTTDVFTYTSLLALASCTAHTVPTMLETKEYLILLQNQNQSIFHGEPIIKYIKQNSRMELPCGEDAIGFLVWWKAERLSKRLNHLLLYAVLIGNSQKKIIEKGYNMGREGSLVVPQVDIEYKGMYSCLSSNGESDGVSVYEIFVYVTPTPNYPIIEGCNHEKYCVLDVENEGNLTCNVNGIRPKVQLQWMAFNEKEPISFKPQQLLIVEKGDTFDIFLTSAYFAKFKPGDRITVVCKVIGSYEDLFDIATTIDLIFSKDLTAVEVTDESKLPQKSNTVIVIPIVMTIVLLTITLVVIAVVKRKRRVTGNRPKLQNTKEERYHMLPRRSRNKESFKDIQAVLVDYLKGRNEHLCYELEKSKDISNEKLQEILRQVCFMGIEISGDDNRQGCAIKLLNVATERKICVKCVFIRECFGSVDLKSSAILTKTNKPLNSNTNFSQLNIKFANRSLETEDVQELEKLFIYASKCPRLKTLKFTNCIMPLHFGNFSSLKDLRNSNVEVQWEVSIFIPTYVLDTSTGRWENNADGCELAKDDHTHLMTCLSEEGNVLGYLQILKGARNYSPRQMVIAQRIFRTMENFFKLHGAETIDTSSFELKETLVQNFEPQYSRLMYYLNDQGDESVLLRFDLTISFVRYIAKNKLTKMKRYHIGKVYRRDSSIMEGRRCGEFYQCDFDIAGEYDLMVPDAECIKVVCTILYELKVGKFVVKVNHENILQGISNLLDVSKENIFAISAIMENNPQASMNELRKVVIEKKLTKDENAARLLEYLKIKGGKDQLENLLKDKDLILMEGVEKGLKDLTLLFQFCEVLGVAEQVQFEMNLTLSLGYYTGLVFEAVTKVPKLHMDKHFKSRGLLANGGRYDDLVAKLTGKTVPSVGFTFDFEQLFALVEFQESNNEIPTKETQVLVSSNNTCMGQEILKLCKELWDAGVKAEIANVRYKDITVADKTCVPFSACIEKEKVGSVEIITESSGEKEYVRRSEFVSFIKNKLQALTEQTMTAERNLQSTIG